MDWKSDWLYALVFRIVECVWKQAQSDGSGEYGPPPDYFVVQETAAGNWERSVCRAPVVRQWIYRGEAFELCGPDNPLPNDEVEYRGMFYSRASFSFHIDSDRKRLLIDYVLGMRYGRGHSYRIVGEGEAARLEPGEGLAWIS